MQFLLAFLLLSSVRKPDHTIVRVCFSDVDYDLEVRTVVDNQQICVVEVPCDKAELVLKINPASSTTVRVSKESHTCK